MNLTPPVQPDPPHITPQVAAPQLAAIEFVRRLDLVLGGLALLIAARFRILGDHTVPLWTRVNRIRGRITRLMARLAAGLTLPARRPRAPRIPSHPRVAQLPRARAWLVRMLGYEAVGYGGQLQTLLESPELAALLAASPDLAARLGRTLRPLCRLLAATPPAALQRPAPPPRPSRARAPKPPRPPRHPARKLHGLFGLPRLAPFPIFPPRKRPA